MSILNEGFKKVYLVFGATMSLGFSAILLGLAIATIVRLFLFGWNFIWLL